MTTPQQQLVNNYYGKNVVSVSAYDKHLLRRHYNKMIDTLYGIEDDEELEVEEVEWKGKVYFRAENGNMYDPDTQEIVGNMPQFVYNQLFTPH